MWPHFLSESLIPHSDKCEYYKYVIYTYIRKFMCVYNVCMSLQEYTYIRVGTCTCTHICTYIYTFFHHKQNRASQPHMALQLLLPFAANS